MQPPDLSQRLSRISTQWSMVFQARGGTADAGTMAVQRLLERYSGAALRYLLGAVRVPEIAEELAQEFALRFVRGDFRRADPNRGRFRDYLKKALIHLVNDYQRRQQAWPRQLVGEPAASTPVASTTAQTTGRSDEFILSWRQELLERTWAALADANPAYHAALRFRIENPDATSAQMGQQLTAFLEKPVSAALARKLLERGQAKFADLLVEEVVCSLENPALEAVATELQELDLLKYCRSALERRRTKGGGDRG